MAQFAGSRDLTLNPGPRWLTDASGSRRRRLARFELLDSATFLASSGDDPEAAVFIDAMGSLGVAVCGMLCTAAQFRWFRR